jgi:UDP-N-acetyl-D-glucosamine dehydrogenase
MKGAAQLRRRIHAREASVAVIGQGYVGLTVAAAAATCGMAVTGVDSDKSRVDRLGVGNNVVPGVDDEVLSLALDTGRLSFDCGFSAVRTADVVLICVPTPVVEHRPDLAAVQAATHAVSQQLRPGSLVVLESTTYPGTTDQIIRPILEATGLRAGRDFLLAYSPERIDPGNDKFNIRNTPRIVGGNTSTSTDLAAAFYAQFVDQVVPVSSTRAAELAKLLENTFRMVNIALVNELAMLCSSQGIDTWEVIRAAATKPFGFMSFQPGPGVGGHCIPLDPTYLAWQSRRDVGRPFRIVELAQDVNAEMPHYVARRVVDTLNARGYSVKGAKVLVLGVTYKPNVGDVRESPAIAVIDQLHLLGATACFHDPYVRRIQRNGWRLNRVPLTPEAIERADCVLILTPHDSYDLPAIASMARLVFDTRGTTPRMAGTDVVTL